VAVMDHPVPQVGVDSSVPTAPAGAPGQSDPRMKRLAFTLTSANVSLYLLWIGAGAFLLPNQVQRITGTTDATALGLASTLGAIFATVGNPVFGQLSDRTRSRFGRRAPWILGCAAIGSVLLVVQSFAGSILVLGISWAFVQLLFNGFQAAVTAVMPDRVPQERYGFFSGLAGVGIPLGIIIAASMFLAAPGLADGGGYYVIAVVMVVAALLLTFGSPDDSSEGLENPPFELRAFLKNFWVSPKEHPDFGWAFLARLFVVLGYFVVFTFNDFILQNYLHLSKDAANKGVGILMMVNALATVCVAVVAGRLADKLDRYKLFVLCSGIGSAFALLIPLAMPSMAGMVLFNVVNGLAFGTYMAVDLALVAKVLPNKDDAAKDMGVINIANAGPQILAPAIAALVVDLSGYHALFVTGAVLALFGSLLVIPIKSVR
jgi:MFS family permease